MRWMSHHNLGAARSDWGDLVLVSCQCAGGSQFVSLLTETFTGTELQLQCVIWVFFGGGLITDLSRAEQVMGVH